MKLMHSYNANIYEIFGKFKPIQDQYQMAMFLLLSCQQYQAYL